ncbi:MAG: hypothetical protein RL757_363 [Bacteroidota bacterium]|jgi:uncharacterized protein YijF (DUF1287 family)
MMKPIFIFLFLCISCQDAAQNQPKNQPETVQFEGKTAEKPIDGWAKRVSDAAISLTHDRVRYDPAYFSIAYPNGDVPADKGVCTDVVIRTYRKLGIDLQKEVHEDMIKNFEKYPKTWGLKKTDTNIDHRRVPNLMQFFSRHATVKPISQAANDYKAGDIVTWNLNGGLTHIGVLVNQYASDGSRPMVVHNIGNGQEISDCLFSFKITGHYFYQK